MTLTLTQARARVRLLIDDQTTVKVTDADINDALTTSQYEAYLAAISSGANVFATEGQVVTDATGKANLATLAPLHISNVSVLTGTTRTPVPPVQARDVQFLWNRTETIVLSYVPRISFPVLDSDPFIWGAASLNIPILDKYMVTIAASELKVVDAEVLQGLETRKNELRTAVEALCNVPNFRVMPLSPLRQNYARYMMVAPDNLQLVTT